MVKAIPAAPAAGMRDVTNSMAKVAIAVPAPIKAPVVEAKPTPVETKLTPMEPKSTPVVVSAPLAAASASVAAEPKDEEDGELTYEEAVARRELRELEEAKLLCSLENKEAYVLPHPRPRYRGADPFRATRCLMCSG